MNSRKSRLSVAAALLVTGSGLALAQSAAGTAKTYRPNFVNIEIQALAESVAMATGQQILLHPQVRGVVTLVTERPLSASQMYSAFALEVALKGYVVEKTGGVVKIYPGKLKD